MTRFILFDDSVPQEVFLSDYSDVRNAILECRRQGALTVMEYDLGEGRCRNVSEDVARDWYDNHLSFSGLDDVDGIPVFVRELIGEQEIQDDWHEYKQGHRAYA